MEYKSKQLDHVQLAAPKGCEEDARAFYGELLGFMEVEKPPVLKKKGGVWFRNGTIHLHIGVEEPFFPAKKAHPAFLIENVEGLKAHLRGNRVEVIEDGNLPGANRFYATDPFGNRLEFLEWVE
ncbi:glyoxalase [Neobacillus piezotolerans]|uniref:Glyoxalase n=1 Tax=Neobacillus piezotolerans TaxID=2259171 RepID=A0A3D8GWG2_9BACI|nr:VOC family protein [Neobacillus piezotolerans]RDU38797.1 glyoxalase [Neobacillus piezotolerans]